MRCHTVQPAAGDRLSTIRPQALIKIVCSNVNKARAQVGQEKQLTAGCHKVKYFRAPSVLSASNATALDCTQNTHSGTYRQDRGCFGNTVKFKHILLTVLVYEVEGETLWGRKWKSWDMSRPGRSDSCDGDWSLMDSIAFVDNQAAMLRQRSDSSPFGRLSWWSNLPECDVKGPNSCETVDETTVGLIVRRSVASLSLEWASEVEKSTVDIPQPITVSARIRAFQWRAQRLG